MSVSLVESLIPTEDVAQQPSTGTSSSDAYEGENILPPAPLNKCILQTSNSSENCQVAAQEYETNSVCFVKNSNVEEIQTKNAAVSDIDLLSSYYGSPVKIDNKGGLKQLVCGKSNSSISELGKFKGNILIKKSDDEHNIAAILASLQSSEFPWKSLDKSSSPRI